MAHKDPEKVRVYNAAYQVAHLAEHRARSAAYYAAHREKVLASQAGYAADRREIKRVYDATYRVANLDKLRVSQSAYRATNAAKIRTYHRAYRVANPEKRQSNAARRRARKANAPINDFTAAQWREIQTAFDHRCVYCEKRAKGHLTQDHITPLSEGGNHTLSNIVPACKSCNSKKGTGKPLCPIQPLLL